MSLGWFEDDGVVRFRRANTAQPDAPTVLLSPRYGLIDVPIPTDEGVECRMFLNPQVRIGTVIQLNSKEINGQFRSVGMKHDADNWKGMFSTWVDLRDLAA